MVNRTNELRKHLDSPLKRELLSSNSNNNSLLLSGQPLDKLSRGQVKLPLVSIIIINYNYGIYLGAAIDSIRAQDYPRIECVVVDNASEDNSREIIAKHCDGDPRFSAIYSENNEGPVGAALRGIEATTGDFVGFYDADDFLLENCISCHVQAHIASIGEVAFTSANVLQVTADGSLLSGRRWGVKKPRATGNGLLPVQLTPLLPTISEGFYQHLKQRAVLLHPTVRGFPWFGSSAYLFRRAILNLIKPSDPTLYTIGKNGFFQSACGYFSANAHWLGGSLVLELPLHVYRMHGKNVFNKRTRFRFNRYDSLAGSFLPKRKFEMCRDILARHQFITKITSPKRFWSIFSQASQRLTEDPNHPRPLSKDTKAVSMIADFLPKLIETFGADKTIQNMRRIIGIRQLWRVARESFPKGIPIRVLQAMVLQLFPKRFRPKVKT